jgi:hypothetical protein
MRTARRTGGLDITSKVLSMREKTAEKKKYQAKGSVKVGLSQSIFVLFSILAVSGAYYLYQVNDLASKGYEIRAIENQIAELQKESKKMKIKEVELKSMYSIEKATENLDLVSSSNVSYLEINGPVAMK